METAIVALIVATAAAWLIRDFVRTFKSGEGACKCGCTSCGVKPDECKDSQNLFKEFHKD